MVCRVALIDELEGGEGLVKEPLVSFRLLLKIRVTIINPDNSIVRGVQPNEFCKLVLSNGPDSPVLADADILQLKAPTIPTISVLASIVNCDTQPPIWVHGRPRG